MKGIEYLRKKLACKEVRVKTRYNFYEMKNITRDLGISTPPALRFFMGSLGWCGKAVDSIADRLSVNEFRNDNFDLNGIFAMNNPDILYDSAILSALIGSCCFVYISADSDGFPRLQVIDGANATGELNPITGMLSEGYAVLERDSSGVPIIEAYFVPGETTFIYHKANSVVTETIVNENVPYCMLVPIIYRPDANRQFGRSRISRACMDIQSSAIRTIKRSEISAEFYSFPQKYVTGLSEDAEPLEKWKATMSSMLQFTKDEDGESPKIGQFQQQSMTPHIEQLRMFAALFGGETGLTLDDLGFATGNPSSSDAIKAAHENLRLTARKAQRTFGIGFLNVGIVAKCLLENYAYKRNAFYETKLAWHPVFEPDGSALSGIGDAAIKINQAVPGYFTKESLADFTGIVGGASDEL